MIEKIKILLRPIYVPIIVPILRRIYGRWLRLNPRSVPVLGPLSINDGGDVSRASVAWMDDKKYITAIESMWSNIEKLSVSARLIRKILALLIGQFSRVLIGSCIPPVGQRHMLFC